jgi:hypothetical protein
LFLKVDSFDTTPVGEPRQTVDAFLNNNNKNSNNFLNKTQINFHSHFSQLI